jgi:phosphatidylglycerol:prolipoprotein diacylglycerol transferase
MRPRIIDFLVKQFHTNFAVYLVPRGIVIYVAAISLVLWLFVQRSKSSGLANYHLLRISIFAICGGIVGARVFYLLQNLQSLLETPGLVLRLGPGTASWGAYVGGLLGFILYSKKAKLNTLKYLDVAGSTLGLGPFIGRWACFLNGCCYGSLSSLPWAVRYPPDSLVYQKQLKFGLISDQGVLSLPVHPVQIYSAIAGLLLFFLLTLIWKKYKQYHGITFLAYWIIYGSIRFGIEFFRGDRNQSFIFNLSLSQIICIVVILVALFLTWRKINIFHTG